MSKIKITCDSTCDLTQEIYEKYNVEVLPLGVTLGETLFSDGVDVTAPKVFDYVAETGILPKTSAISLGEYLEVFKKYVDDGYTVIHINISSEFSFHPRAVAARTGRTEPSPCRYGQGAHSGHQRPVRA